MKPGRPLDETDLCALHEQVDVELPAELLSAIASTAPASITNLASTSSSTAPTQSPVVRSRTTLSLQEYKKKHGLI